MQRQESVVEFATLHKSNINHCSQSERDELKAKEKLYKMIGDHWFDAIADADDALAVELNEIYDYVKCRYCRYKRELIEKYK